MFYTFQLLYQQSRIKRKSYQIQEQFHSMNLNTFVITGLQKLVTNCVIKIAFVLNTLITDSRYDEKASVLDIKVFNSKLVDSGSYFENA